MDKQAWLKALLYSPVPLLGKGVGWALSEFYHPNEKIFPSKEKLAELARVSSTKTVTVGLEQLREAGFITWIVERQPGAKYAGNLYTFLTPVNFTDVNFTREKITHVNFTHVKNAYKSLSIEKTERDSLEVKFTGENFTHVNFTGDNWDNWPQVLDAQKLGEAETKILKKFMDDKHALKCWNKFIAFLKEQPKSYIRDYQHFLVKLERWGAREIVEKQGTVEIKIELTKEQKFYDLLGRANWYRRMGYQGGNYTDRRILENWEKTNGPCYWDNYYDYEKKKNAGKTA